MEVEELGGDIVTNNNETNNDDCDPGQDVAGPDGDTSPEEMQQSNEDYNQKLPSSKSNDQREWKTKAKSMNRADIMSPRVQQVISTLKKIRQSHPGEKVLLFSKFRKILDIVERAISEFEMSDDSTVLRFDGTVNPKLRESVKTSFNQSSSFTVMLVTSGCGGAGLNLASASHVVLLEPWWRVSDERQAIARAYRQGQSKEVHVWRIVRVDSIVDGILKAPQTKKALVADDIMAELCRPDGVAPVVPYQHPFRAGEF